MNRTQRILVCLAFGFLCFANTWVEFGRGESAYYAHFDPVHAILPGVLIWVAILAFAMFVIEEILNRRIRPLPAHLLFFIACLIPLGAASLGLLRILPFDLGPIIRTSWFWPTVCLLGAVPIVVAVRRPGWVHRTVRDVLLYSWPVLALLLVQAARGTLVKYPHPAYADGPFEPAFAGTPPVRAIWIVFDELSERIAFDHRPDTLSLPNFDRFRNESLFARAATAPSTATILSMPSLVDGEIVQATIPKGPREALLQTNSGEMFWSAEPNVFDDARKLGLNAAIVGWYHPYCRILNRNLTQCYWTAPWLVSGVEERSHTEGLLGQVWDRARLQFFALPLAGHLPGAFAGVNQRVETRERLDYLLAHARAIVANPSIGLALIHLPVPHPPAVYDRRSGHMTTVPGSSYLDGVALADRLLGMLRADMEHAGLWDRTAVLISADHGWRTAFWRADPTWTAEDEGNSHQDTTAVPFLLKMPEQKTNRCYDRPFNTVITRRLLDAILSGESESVDDVVALIDHR